LNTRENERKVEEVTGLLWEFGGELALARSELDDALDRYEEGWEDRVTDTAIGLGMLIGELLDRIEAATGEKWVDLRKGEIADEP